MLDTSFYIFFPIRYGKIAKFMKTENGLIPTDAVMLTK